MLTEHTEQLLCAANPIKFDIVGGGYGGGGGGGGGGGLLMDDALK